MRPAFSLFIALFPIVAWSQAPTPAGLPGDDPPPPPPPNCSPAEFRTLALEAPESKRAQSAMRWLQSTGKNCSLDRLVLIRNNRVQWLGSADTPGVAGEIDRLIELGLKDDPEGVSKLFRSAPPPSAPGAAPAGAKP